MNFQKVWSNCLSRWSYIFALIDYYYKFKEEIWNYIIFFFFLYLEFQLRAPISRINPTIFFRSLFLPMNRSTWAATNSNFLSVIRGIALWCSTLHFAWNGTYFSSVYHFPFRCRIHPPSFLPRTVGRRSVLYTYIT